MRIPKNKTQEIKETAKRFLLVADAMDGDIVLHKEGRTLLSLSITEEGFLTVKAQYSQGETLTLYAENARGHEVILTQGYARLGLYIDGVLMDEDFFFGELDFSESLIEAGTFMHFEAGFEYHSALESTPIENVIENPDGFRPVGREMGILSARGAVLFERLHIFYLDNRRQGQAKAGKGGHRAQAIYTETGKLFGTAPMAVAIDDKKEYSVLDAACFYQEGRAYLYYLMQREEGRVCRVAVSEDGFSFQKTELDIDSPAFSPDRVTSLQMWKDESGVYLVFAENGVLYAAKSLDLLHFEKPFALEGVKGASEFSLFAYEGKAYLLALSQEETLLYTAKGALPQWKPSSAVAQALPLRHARGITYNGAFWLIGEKNGALFARPATLSENKITV